MKGTVTCVLRTGPGFRADHVYWLGRQVARFMPDWQFLPFVDTPMNIPHVMLEKDDPSWWAKMEAMERLPDGPVVTMDIDTVLVRPWSPPIPAPGRAFMRVGDRDPMKVWGGLQVSSPEFRKAVTTHYRAHTDGLMTECIWCDQRYYNRYWIDRIDPLQIVCPDEVVSYKMHVMDRGLKPDMAVVMFHAHPRPWAAPDSWIPPLEVS